MLAFSFERPEDPGAEFFGGPLALGGRHGAEAADLAPAIPGVHVRGYAALELGVVLL